MRKSYIVDQAQAGWTPLLESAFWLQPVNQTELMRLIEELGQALITLHQAGRHYLQWDTQNIFVDQGHIYLLDAPARSDSCLQAFEVLAQDPAWPIGAAADVYGLASLLRGLISKHFLPPASARWLQPSGAVSSVSNGDYQPRFLRAIDLATELDPQFRLSSIQELWMYLGLPVASATEAALVSGRRSSAAIATTQQVIEPVAPMVSAKRHVGPWAVGSLLLVLAIGITGLLFYTFKDGLGDKQSVQAVMAPPTHPSEPLSTSPSKAAPVQPAALEKPSVSDDWELAGDSPNAAVSVLSEPQELVFTEPTPLALRDEPLLASASEPADSEADDLRVMASEQSQGSSTETTAVVVSPAQKVATVLVTPPARADSAGAKPVSKQAVSVSLRIQPWGDVYVNGRRHGASPPLRSLNLKPGSYRIQVRNGDLPVHEEKIEVKAGQALTISHKF